MATELLLIEDNKVLNLVETRHLCAAFPEIAVRSAQNGQQARQLVDESPPDVVVMDCHLPDCQYQALLGELITASPNVSVIITSADPPASLKRREYEAIIFEVIAKPYETDQLVGSVSRALRSKGYVYKPGNRPSSEPVVDPPVPAAADRHKALNLLSGFMAVLRAFESDLEAEVQHPRRVRQTVEQYIPRLINLVRDMTAVVKSFPQAKD